jgi:hypothetical protein
MLLTFQFQEGAAMRKVSVGILGFVGIVALLISFASMGQAYFVDYNIGGNDGPPVSKVGAGDPELVKALRGIRGTSAAYSAAFAVLFLATVFGPYKRGDKWAWWALLAASLVLAAVVLPRLVFVGTTLGVGTAMAQVGLIIVALLLDVSRLRASAS